MQDSDFAGTAKVSRSISNSFTRYDLLLAIIPAVFAVALLASLLFPISVQSSLVLASSMSAIALIDGLFRNPPTAGSNI